MDSAPRAPFARALIERINKIAPSNALMALLFATLATVTIVMLYRAPIGPGQDYHYHLMAAAMNARPSNDPIRSLYLPLHPFDANTLVYRVAWPFIKLFGPVRGFQAAVALLLNLGFPAACWYALHRSKRAPWGALLAFVFVFSRGWAVDGFVPFLTSGAFMVWALAEWEAIFAKRDARPRTAIIRGAIASCLLFLAHGHTYVWTTIVLGGFTLFAAIREFIVDPEPEDEPAKRADDESAAPATERTLRSRAIDALKIAGYSLAAIAPSLILLASWYRRAETYAPPIPTPRGQEWRYPEIPLILRNSLQAADQYFTPLVTLEDYRFVAALALLSLGLLLVVRRDHKQTQYFEWFALLSLATFIVGPSDIKGQSVAPRQIEFFTWALPLVLWRAKEPTLRTAAENVWHKRLAELALIGLVMAFSVKRIKAVEAALVGLNRVELAPLLALEGPCRQNRRTPYSKLAYMPMSTASSYVQSVSMHQAHETLAAICGVETPVYNSRVRPHHLLPLRYRSAMPAPVGIFPQVGYWFVEDTGIVEAYDLYLTYQWEPTAEQRPVLEQRVVLVARSGPYSLYRRR